MALNYHRDLSAHVTEICQLVTANGRARTRYAIGRRCIFQRKASGSSRGDAGAALARDLGMVCRVQVSLEPEPAESSTPGWFTPRLSAGSAELVAAAECLGRMTGLM